MSRPRPRRCVASTGRAGPMAGTARDCRTMGARPPVWIGHARLTASDLDRSADFWRTVGMREIERNQQVVVLELRGGTHLVLVPGAPGGGADAPFDLMGRRPRSDSCRVRATRARRVAHRARAD